MKRDRAHVVGEYLDLLEKGDQDALVEFVARHANEIGSLSRLVNQSETQDLPPKRRVPILESVVLVALLLFSLGLVGMEILPSLHGLGAPPAATLAQVEGIANILPAGGTAWETANAGVPLKEGDRIRTGPHSVAQLAFHDGSFTDLDFETEVVITRMGFSQGAELGAIALNQQSGRTYNRIQPSPDSTTHFEIETPTAHTAVRGTQFAVNVDADGSTQVVVVEGVVAVTAQEVTVEVQASQETKVERQKAPESVQATSAALPLPIFEATSAVSGASEEPQAPNEAGQAKPTHTPKPEEAQASRTPKPTQTVKASKTPKPTTNTPKPTHAPNPTHTPKPTNTPKPTPEQKPTQKPHPTQKPQPTQKPRLTQKPKPTKKP